MYTQCPECDVAFRVTAEVLKQAAGRVRCGGCGSAFNALDHLSEQLPQSEATAADKPKIPELTPARQSDPKSGSGPTTISAEQSVALLKTLDQLAGEDIRIEDTGTEWRVLDADEDGEESETPKAAETGSMKFILQDDEPEEPEQSGQVEELRFDDNTPLPDDFDVDAKSVSAPEPEPRVEEASEEPEDPDSSPDELTLGDPDEWQDLLGEADETESAALTDKPLDMDAQFAVQAEAMGIDLSGIHQALDEDDVSAEQNDTTIRANEKEFDTDIVEMETTIEQDLMAAAFATEAARSTDITAAAEVEADEEPDEANDETKEELEDEVEAEATEELEEDPEEDPEEDLEEDLEEDPEEDLEEDLVEDTDEETDEDADEEADAQLEEALEADADVEFEDITAAGQDEHVIPPQSEEEKTINMLIDQDLLSLAVEDEDGFASTIVQKQTGGNDVMKELAGENPHVETIIMEGDFVRTELERERLASGDDSKSTMSSTAAFVARAKRTMTSHIRSVRRDDRPSGYGTTIGVIALCIMLAMQYIHQSREMLATRSLFNNFVGPIYRSIGNPVTPAWDVSGWRFEATKGSADEDEEVLTIYSRVGNKSDRALPYPLVHVSLTDRYEEIIGSRVLEPIEYLVGDPDPRKAVAPGSTFDAVIAIETPTSAATGFKLNVCYRLEGGQLRCAIEDFK